MGSRAWGAGPVLEHPLAPAGSGAGAQGLSWSHTPGKRCLHVSPLPSVPAQCPQPGQSQQPPARRRRCLLARGEPAQQPREAEPAPGAAGAGRGQESAPRSPWELLALLALPVLAPAPWIAAPAQRRSRIGQQVRIWSRRRARGERGTRALAAQGSEEQLGQRHGSQSRRRAGGGWLQQVMSYIWPPRRGREPSRGSIASPQTLPVGPKPGEGQSGRASDIPGMLPARGYRQDTRGRDEGAPGYLPAAWHSPIPKGLPSATTLIFLPALTLGWPRGAHSLATAHTAQFSNSTIA